MLVMVYFNSMSAAGGIERVIASHIGFMCEMHQIVLVTKDFCPSFYPLSIEVQRESLHVDFTMNMESRWRRVAKIAFSSLRTITALRQLFKNSVPGVVYVASPLNLLEVFLAGMDMRRIVVTEHSSFSAYNWVYKKIISKLYPSVGLLTVPTKMDSEGYMRRGIRNAYVPNPISFYPNEISDLSSRWALCVGRFTDDKRHDLLLDIWYLSGIQRLGWKLRIIGKGECEPDLRKKILALGLNESVFIEGPTSSIQEKYFASSIFLLTSRAEGFGLVLAEAMAFGVPCICFDCPSGPRDIVDEGLTGRLLKEGDIDGYVEALRELAMNPTRRLEFGERARASVKKFQAKAVGAEFMKVFREVFDKCPDGI
jgi:glycosyltransferase involved in cell wall biosynthesis